jgi:hypothetical protein
MSDEREISIEQLLQLVDQAELNGGFIVINRNIKVGDEVLSLGDTLRFREIMMQRQREREADHSADYKVAQEQGYRAAVRELREHVGGMRLR